MNLREGYQLYAARPLSLFLCHFLLFFCLLRLFVYFNKIFSFATENGVCVCVCVCVCVSVCVCLCVCVCVCMGCVGWGGLRLLATNPKLYCNLASYLYNKVSNNQCVCAPKIWPHVRKTKMALMDSIFPIMQGECI